jgi:plastocyanin
MARSLRRVLPLLLGAACLVLVAACGSDNNDSSSSSDSTPAAAPPADTTSTPATGGGATTVDLTATAGSSGFGFDPKDGTAKDGKVTLNLTNPTSGGAPHAIAIEGNGLDKDGPVVQPDGSKSTISVDLKPGKYVFYCPVDDHRQEGMEGTLTVG